MEVDYESIFRLLLINSKGMQKISSNALKDYGFNSIHTLCLYTIGLHDNLSASDICEITNSDKGAVSRTIASLINMGYIERSINNETKRAYRASLELTDKGKSLFKLANETINSKTEEALSIFSQEELSLFYRSLEKLKKQLYK